MGFWDRFKYKLFTKSVGLFINSWVFFNKRKAANWAYQLFSNPRKGRLQDYTPFLLESERQTLQSKGDYIQTYFWKQKKVETVLLIHGWESNSGRWQEMVEFLTERNFNVVSLDAPGQGMSSGKELNPIHYSRFLSEVCKTYEPDYLIGHSLGGMSVFYFMSQYDFPFIKKIVGLGSPNKFSRITKNYKNLLSLSESAFTNYLNVFKTRFDIDIPTFSSEEFIPSIRVPILLMHDHQDQIVPYSDAEEIIAKNKHVHFISTENLGHSMYHPDVYQTVYAFLRDTSYSSKIY